ncbi:transcriptional regulator with XRE-family HTH domain [Bradyrhizobium elkanii]|nr:transcriptional regulator with XRE-family HTH domain [Bradyrhizobium elkanii]
MDLKEVMAVNLRRIRHVKKMTQEELADGAGLSVRYVGAIERADVSASVTVLGRIAEALGVEATDLVKRTTVHFIPIGLDDATILCPTATPARRESTPHCLTHKLIVGFT